jgi:hypothetical protein
MAQTAAQKKAAAANQKAADQKVLAQAQALLAKSKTRLAELEKTQAAAAGTPFGQAGSAAGVGNRTPFGQAVPNFKPTITFDTAPSNVQIGPMIGPNLGRDAAYALAQGMKLTPEQQAAAEAFNVGKGLNPDGTAKNVKEPISKETRDAYALLEAAFKEYGLDSLVPIIRQYMEDDLGPEQAKLKLRSEPVYKQRFKGNELRLGKGLNALSEVDYLELENDYSETLRSYGLSDYFGTATDATTRLARQQKMADVIGNNISALEFKDRIKTVVTRVNMADANVKNELKAFYNITDTDLIKYFLNPAEGTDRLKEKVTAAEISSASITQGLGRTSLGTAEELARLGIDRAEALAGYSKIAEYLPTSEKLSSIYKEQGITYNKATGEEEEFKGLASAKRKRERLKGSETSTFAGSSGTSQLSLKNKTTAGQI